MICYIYIRNTFEMNMTGLKQFYMEFSINVLICIMMIPVRTEQLTKHMNSRKNYEEIYRMKRK